MRSRLCIVKSSLGSSKRRRKIKFLNLQNFLTLVFLVILQNLAKIHFISTSTSKSSQKLLKSSICICYKNIKGNEEGTDITNVCVYTEQVYFTYVHQYSTGIQSEG